MSSTSNLEKARRAKESLLGMVEDLPDFAGLGLILDPQTQSKYAIRVNFSQRIPDRGIPTDLEGVNIYTSVIDLSASSN